MPKPLAIDEIGLECFKVRVVVGTTVLHFLSRTAPAVEYYDEGGAYVASWDLIEGTDHGDTCGFIDWSAVKAITWRRAATPRVGRGT